MAMVCIGTRIQGVIGIGYSPCSIVIIHAVYSSLVVRIVICSSKLLSCSLSI